jgi:hypothetical protein
MVRGPIVPDARSATCNSIEPAAVEMDANFGCCLGDPGGGASALSAAWIMVIPGAKIELPLPVGSGSKAGL